MHSVTESCKGQNKKKKKNLSFVLGLIFLASLEMKEKTKKTIKPPKVVLSVEVGSNVKKQVDTLQVAARKKRVRQLRR